jgi:hypothetical protein
MEKREKNCNNPSQVELTDAVKRIYEEWSLPKIETPDDLMLVRKKLFSEIEFRPYNDLTKEEEEKIRWKRTGTEVIEDRYVYQGKACTDLIVAFTVLAKAGGVEETRFVKLKSNENNMVHSVGEFKLENEWYIFDASNSKSVPEKGEITDKYGPFLLWKKGRDAWDLGLTEFDTIRKIEV